MPEYDKRASADAMVADGMANTNYDTDTNLHIGERSDGGIVEAYVNFDLSGMPSHYRVTEATFSLCQYDDDYDWQSATTEIACELCGGAWTESGITWNTKPASAAGVDPALKTITNLNTWYNFTVTEMMRAVADGTVAWNGFRLRYTGTSSSTMKYFRSRDYSNAAYHPRLLITYEEMRGKIAIVKGAVEKQIVGIKVAPVKGAVDKTVIGVKIAPAKGAIDKTVF